MYVQKDSSVEGTCKSLKKPLSSCLIRAPLYFNLPPDFIRVAHDLNLMVFYTCTQGRSRSSKIGERCGNLSHCEVIKRGEFMYSCVMVFPLYEV